MNDENNSHFTTTIQVNLCHPAFTVNNLNILLSKVLVSGCHFRVGRRCWSFLNSKVPNGTLSLYMTMSIPQNKNTYKTVYMRYI